MAKPIIATYDYDARAFYDEGVRRIGVFIRRTPSEWYHRGMSVDRTPEVLQLGKEGAHWVRANQFFSHPSIHLDEQAAQELADTLRHAGAYPRGGESSPAAAKAMQSHIDDLRAIALGVLKIPAAQG